MKNKKSILWAFLALVVFCVGAIATGSSSSSDFVISGGVLTSYTGSDTTVYVPDGVTTISVDAFDDATISVIYLPTSVTTVENDSFALCSADVKVVFEMTSPTAQLPSGMENWGVANAGGQITTYTTSGITTYTLSDVSAIAVNGSYIGYGSLYEHVLNYTGFNVVDAADLLLNVNEITYTNTISPPSNSVDVSLYEDKSVMTWIDGTIMYYAFEGDELIFLNGISSDHFGLDVSADDTKISKINGLEYFNVTNERTIQLMFKDLHSIEELDLSSFDLTSVDSYGLMFEGCTSLMTVYARTQYEADIYQPMTTATVVVKP